MITTMRKTIWKSPDGNEYDAFISDDKIKGDLGDEYCVDIKRIKENKKRVLKQLNLYWKACEYTANNASHDKKYLQKKEDIDYHCKVNCNHGEWKQVKVYIDNTSANNVMMKLFNAGSISFDNCTHLDACGYFTNAFHVMADELGMDKDSFIQAVKESCESNL